MKLYPPPATDPPDPPPAPPPGPKLVQAKVDDWLLRSIIALDHLLSEEFCEHVGAQDAGVIRDARNAMANAVGVPFRFNHRSVNKSEEG